MPRIGLRAAPTGKRCGLLVASDGATSLLVAILPKHWRAGAARHLLLPPGSSTITAVLYEGDVLAMESESAPARLVLGALARTNRDPELFDLVAPGQRTVMALPLTPLDDVVALFGLARDLTPQGRSAPVVMDVTGPSSEAFAWARLVTAATQAVRQVRQGYVEREEWLSPVRGRVVTRDPPQARLERRTALLCRYDDVTVGTPAQRIVATALDVCARPADTVTALVARALGNVQEAAVAVRRLMRNIPSMASAGDAIVLGRRLTLPREDGAWRAAYDAALAVLEHRHETPRLERSDIRIAEVVVHPARLWELLLERAARTRWPHAQVIRPTRGRADDDVNVLAPWRRVDDTDLGVYPDLIVASRTEVWCADAKYKVLSGIPKRSDLYQMFAYSHLTHLTAGGLPVTRCALLYPASTGREAAAPFTLARSDSSIELDVATLPWPSPDEARRSLDAFIRRLAAALPGLVTT